MTAAHLERDRDRPDVALDLLNRAVDQLTTAPESAERDRVLVAATAGVGDVHRRAARYPAAAAALARALDIAERLGEPGPLTTVVTVLGIVAKELGEFDLAARHYARVTGLHRAAGAAAADVASHAHNLAGLAYARGQYAEAGAHARRALSLRVRQPVETAEDMAVLAAALAGENRYEEAADLLERAMHTCRTAIPPRRYELAVQLHGLAAVDQAAGRIAVAETRYREALALKEELLGPEHPEVALVLHNLGTLFRAEGRPDEAAACVTRALPIMERTYPATHRFVVALRASA